MSHRKSLLVMLELIAWLVGGCGLLIAFCAFAARLPAVPTDAAFVFAFLAILIPFAAATYLITEYRTSTSHPGKPVSNSEDISSSEIAALVMWAPSAHTFAAGLGLLAGLASLFGLGNFSLHAHDDLQPPQAYGIAGLLLIFAWLPLPVLASAARMPGTYSEHFTWQGADGA